MFAHALLFVDFSVDLRVASSKLTASEVTVLCP